MKALISCNKALVKLVINSIHLIISSENPDLMVKIYAFHDAKMCRNRWLAETNCEDNGIKT